MDRYVPLLSMCVCDSNEIVRKHTITLLTKLLSEDYIKWKGLLFFRFLMALVDPSPAVQVFGTPLFLVLGWRLCGTAVKFYARHPALCSGGSGGHGFFVRAQHG